MKKLLLIVIFSLSQNLLAQGVMPVPGNNNSHDSASGADCRSDQNFAIILEPLLSPFRINLSSLCDQQSLYGDAFAPTTNYIHNRARCEEIALCAPAIAPDDEKQAANIIADNISNVVLIGALTKEISDNRDYNKALMAYEQKHNVKVCADAPIDFDCDQKLRKSLATVADSLVDYPEFTNAPASSDDLQVFVPKVFFNGAISQSAIRTLEDLKKNCSQKFSLKRVCANARDRVEQVKKCDSKTNGKNCFENEQKAWASITNDLKNNHSLFLAIERQLCLPSRLSKSPSQAVLGFAPLVPMRSRQRVSTEGSQMRTQLMISTANANAESNANSSAAKEKEANRLPDGSDIKRQDSSISELKPKPQDNRADIIHEVDGRDSKSLSERFSNSMSQAAENNKGINGGTVSNPIIPNNWNSDFINRARDFAEEQRALIEEQKRKQEEANNDSVSQTDKKKKEEIDALNSQISGLKSKLDEMSAKVEDLKGKKGDTSAADKDKEALQREADIVDLKKKIAELEADKKKKEADAKAARDEEDARGAARAREERSRSTYTSPLSQGNYSNRNKQNIADTNAEAANREREKVASSMAGSAVGSSDAGRSPASLGSSAGNSGAVSSQLVLKAVGTQATPESNVVYMTPNELQRYPYRLSDNATAGEIEKMLEGNKGSTIILGDREQIVPIVENGVVALDEQGKIKYKRIKISLVKNDKERKQSIAREISSIGDLKKEEQRKRDLIRYKEMKKALQVK